MAANSQESGKEINWTLYLEPGNDATAEIVDPSRCHLLGIKSSKWSLSEVTTQSKVVLQEWCQEHKLTLQTEYRGKVVAVSDIALDEQKAGEHSIYYYLSKKKKNSISGINNGLMNNHNGDNYNVNYSNNSSSITKNTTKKSNNSSEKPAINGNNTNGTQRTQHIWTNRMNSMFLFLYKTFTMIAQMHYKRFFVFCFFVFLLCYTCSIVGHLFFYRCCHDKAAPVITKMEYDDGTVEYEFDCNCIGKECGSKGRSKKGMIRVVNAGTRKESLQLGWFNFQKHIFDCDPDLWQRIVYVTYIF